MHWIPATPCTYKTFCKKDPLLVAQKKWYDYIHDDFHYFWDLYSNIISYHFFMWYWYCQATGFIWYHLFYQSRWSTYTFKYPRHTFHNKLYRPKIPEGQKLCTIKTLFTLHLGNIRSEGTTTSFPKLWFKSR